MGYLAMSNYTPVESLTRIWLTCCVLSRAIWPSQCDLVVGRNAHTATSYSPAVVALEA